jgi:primary-amine oxidase
MKVSFLTVVLLGLTARVVAAPDPRHSWRGQSGGTSFTTKRSERRPLHARDTCPAPADIPTTAPKANPFVPFTQAEIDSVAEWLLSPSQGLNLTNTSSPTLSLSDNYIWRIDVFKPNKTDVLAYLDGNTTVPRYAHVALIQGGLDVPIVAEYSVSQIAVWVLPV